MIYLDFASTTPVEKEIIKKMNIYFSKIFGNPSSLHSFGQMALRAIDQARDEIRKIIQADYFNEIIFTSSATESNNLAIKGLVYFFYYRLNTKPHVITTEIEHPSVIQILRDLRKNNLVDYDFLPINSEGIVDYQKIEKVIKENTCLVSIHYVNSEIGTIQPINEIGKLIGEINKDRELKIYFHTDASQAPLTEDISVKNLNVDLMTISGHKIYGPKGISFLYKKFNIALEKIISGSEQEFELRAGTENVPLIVGLCEALKLAYKARLKTKKHLNEIRNYFLLRLKDNKIDFKINGSLTRSTPKIINIFFPQKTSQELLIYLDRNKIYLSAGSACQSRSVVPSYVISKLYPERAKKSIRFSFGKETTKHDIDYVVKKLNQFLNK